MGIQQWNILKGMTIYRFNDRCIWQLKYICINKKRQHD
jgi:hypothetical protein